MLLWRFSMLFVLCLFPSFGLAQEVWDLSRILSRAADNAPLLKASELNVESAGEWAKQEGRWENPDISVSHGSYTEMGVRGTATNLAVLQSVPVFGQKDIARKIGEQEMRIAESDRNIQKLVVHHDVVGTTYRLAAILEQEKHIAHRRERLELITRYLRTRPFASPVQVIEKNLIENRMREIEEKIAELLSKKEEIWQHLNLYLGLEASIVPQVKWYSTPVTTAVPDIMNLQNSSPDLIRQSQRMSKAELQLEREGKRAYPNIQLGAGHYDQEVGTNQQSSLVGIVQFSVPLWNRGTNARNAARAESEMEKLKFEYKRREVGSALQKSVVHLKETERKIELYPPTLVEKLEKQMHAAESNWKKGLVNATAFLELENQVHEQTDRVYDVQVEYVQALSQLQVLIGQNPSMESK